MRRIVAGLVLAVMLLAAGPALAYDDGGDQGSGNDQRRCSHAENCRGSFSPGPFDRSPVDIHDNQICISPDCSGKGAGKQPPAEDRPAEMITNPAKLVQFPLTIAKMSLDFASSILRLVV